jgi:hypothetical protein
VNYTAPATFDHDRPHERGGEAPEDLVPAVRWLERNTGNVAFFAVMY